VHLLRLVQWRTYFISGALASTRITKSPLFSLCTILSSIGDSLRAAIGTSQQVFLSLITILLEFFLLRIFCHFFLDMQKGKVYLS
jgi:hypothetical protein